ncbi:MAG: hypothetical protein ACO3V0_08720, partial [Ilumatobacteraceae bacterium]
LLAQSESTTSRAAQLASDLDRLGRPRSLAEIAREAAEVDLDRLRAFTRDRLDLDWIEDRSEVHLGPTAS